MSPGRGLGVMVGRRVAVAEGRNVSVTDAVGADVAVGAAKDPTQALRSVIGNKEKASKKGARFIRCLLYPVRNRGKITLWWQSSGGLQ
jgi:hypothetical protein